MDFGKRTEAAFLDLERWIDKNGWAGYDPYDIKGQAWYVNLFGRQTPIFRKFRGVLFLTEKNLPPNALRKLLRIKKDINAKGLGLMASAYLTRYKATGKQQYLKKAEEILEWLAINRSSGYPGVSWGYPFHWQSRIFIPRDTPSSVVTGTVGDAWLDHYELTGTANSLAVASRIADFFLDGLNRYEKSKDEICFSYTPIDTFKVHNASLFSAAFLARFGALAGKDHCKSLALKAVRYTLSEQNNDGSFFYWGAEPPTIIDHYHTGFVLRHLDTIQRATGAEFIVKPLSQGYQFYLNKLFTEDGVPKFTPDSLYPIDIHSCAEALLCLSQIGASLGSFDRLSTVFQFTIENMRNNEGFYIAEIRKRLWGEQRVNVPYMRWGQAWMFLALARLHAALQR